MMAYCSTWKLGLVVLYIVLYIFINRVKISQVAGLQITVTSDNVRLNLANVRAKVILIGHWSDQKNILSHTFFCCDKIRLQIHSICILQ